MLIERLVYGMEYGGPLSMSQFSFGIFPLFGFRHSLLCLQPNSKQSAQKRHGYELESDDRFWGQQKKQGCGNGTCNPEVSGCRTDGAAGDKCAIYLIIYILHYLLDRTSCSYFCTSAMYCSATGTLFLRLK